MSLYYGKRAPVAKSGIGARRNVSNTDFENLWEESSESSSDEEQQQQDAPVERSVVQPPVPIVEVPPPVREPTRKEIMSAQRLYGDRMNEAQIIDYLKKRFAREAEAKTWEPEQPKADTWGQPAPAPTHFSSDDFAPKQPSQYWSPNYYQDQQAISSEQLFPEQRRVGVRETLRNTFTQVVSDLSGPQDDFS
jgi:hypothetical protein